MDLNVRHFDDQLYARARAVAESRWSKREAPLKRLVTLALQEYLTKEINGAGPRPKLHMCANCFQINAQRAREARGYAIDAQTLAGATADPTPFSQAEGSGAAPGEAPKGRISPFAHLLGENPSESLEAATEGALEGLAGALKHDRAIAEALGDQFIARAEAPPFLAQTSAAPELTEVFPGLWVGKDRDRLWAEEKGWSILAAAKDPWHRDIVGYSTFAAPKDSPEFYAARRENCLYLNFVDVRKLGPKGETYVAPQVINAAMEFLKEQRAAVGNTVLIHCNQGRSRGPFLAFMYLWGTGVLPADKAQALTQFKAAHYPAFHPSAGIAKYLEGLK